MGPTTSDEDYTPKSPSCLWNEAVENHQRFAFDDQPALLDRAVDSYRELLNLSTTTQPLDIPERCNILGAIDDALTRLYKHIGGSVNIDSAIVALREALSLSSNDNTTARVHLLVDLAEALCTGYESREGSELLDEAIAVSRGAVHLSRGTDDALYCAALHELSRTLLSSYLARSGTPEQLDECLQLSRQGLQFCTDKCTHFTQVLHHLGTVLMHQCSCSFMQDAIEEAEGMLYYVLHSRFLGSPERRATLASLARLSLYRYQATGDTIHLQQARIMGKEALSLCPDESPFRNDLLQACGIYAMQRYLLTLYNRVD